jgi:hypothetical protein
MTHKPIILTCPDSLFFFKRWQGKNPLPSTSCTGNRLGVAIKHTMNYNTDVKYFSWNPEMNEWLKTERHISFEELLFYIEQGGILDIVKHPNPEKYKGQRIFIVNVDNYAYLVPFVETDDEVFLKTVIPSRKATQRYLPRDEDEQDE